jgi:carbon-monoxide dehydrogenase medium subunit
VKPAPFAYQRPGGVADAVDLLQQNNGLAKLLAGGQSLGPMLNMRLVQPRLLIDVTGIPELKRADIEDDALVLGACITHADIEDRRVPDVTAGLLPHVAEAVAYRAVRNRGTLGGSLTHADPAADWISVLCALGADAMIYGPRGRYRIPVSDYVTGAFEVALADDELLEAVRVPRLQKTVRWGFYKVCRRMGEFADAIGTVLYDPDRGVCRAVVGATGSKPLVLADKREVFRSGGGFPRLQDFDAADAEKWLERSGLHEPIDRRLHLIALKRAIDEAAS